jgi:hypothetical protein
MEGSGPCLSARDRHDRKGDRLQSQHREGGRLENFLNAAHTLIIEVVASRDIGMLAPAVCASWVAAVAKYFVGVTGDQRGMPRSSG